MAGGATLLRFSYLCFLNTTIMNYKKHQKVYLIYSLILFLVGVLGMKACEACGQ